MTGCVDFSEYNTTIGDEASNPMYESFKNATSKDTELSKWTYYDDDKKTIWLCWYDEVILK